MSGTYPTAWRVIIGGTGLDGSDETFCKHTPCNWQLQLQCFSKQVCVKLDVYSKDPCANRQTDRLTDGHGKKEGEGEQAAAVRACASKAQNGLQHPTYDRMEKENSFSFSVSANRCVLKLNYHKWKECSFSFQKSMGFVYFFFYNSFVA